MFTNGKMLLEESMNLMQQNFLKPKINIWKSGVLKLTRRGDRVETEGRRQSLYKRL